MCYGLGATAATCVNMFVHEPRDMGNEIHHRVAGVICGSSGTTRATGKALTDSEKMCPHIRAARAKQVRFILLGRLA